MEVKADKALTFIKEMIEKSRPHVRGPVGADPEEICFTGCAAESNGAILKSLSSRFFP
ncbi:MAG: hypothetical protein GF401_15845 [Chitinivibrionales bacterium]|nr:hypothetical protein [Chitinivibrionales bacterium]